MNSTAELKKYRKETDYSYTWGLFPTIELLTRRSDLAQIVYYHTRAADHAGWAKIQDLCRQHNVEFVHNDRMVSRLQGNDSELVIGVFTKKLLACTAEANHVVLVNVDDMGNLGTIIRTMLDFNLSDLILIEPAADVFHPKVVRASMGALFQLRVSHFLTLAGYCQAFPRQEKYLFASSGRNLLQGMVFKQPFALVFGNEGAGLSSSDLTLGEVVKIPQSDKVDSLNLAIAAGIGMYEATN
jgi:TrmH family RNA methyltransferase